MLLDAGDPDAGQGGVDARHHVHPGPADFAFLSPSDLVGPTEHAECVLEVGAFVRGDRVGLDRLIRVLPSIFKTYPGCNPHDVLVESGLCPRMVDPDAKYPTFYFKPDRDGRAMIEPRWAEVRSPRVSEIDTPLKTRALTSDELVEAYESARGSWSLSLRS
jgi:hypothetical protein